MREEAPRGARLARELHAEKCDDARSEKDVAVVGEDEPREPPLLPRLARLVLRLCHGRFSRPNAPAYEGWRLEQSFQIWERSSLETSPMILLIFSRTLSWPLAMPALSGFVASAKPLPSANSTWTRSG